MRNIWLRKAKQRLTPIFTVAIDTLLGDTLCTLRQSKIDGRLEIVSDQEPFLALITQLQQSPLGEPVWDFTINAKGYLAFFKAIPVDVSMWFDGWSITSIMRVRNARKSSGTHLYFSLPQ